MRKFIIFALFIFTALLTSCTKYTFMPYQNKILGEWRFEKVIYNEAFSLHSIDYSNDYKNTSFTFYNNGNLVSKNNGARGRTFQGNWTLIKDAYIDDNGDREDSYQLKIVIYNTVTNRDEYYFWDISSITGNKLRATENVDGGIYRYVMQRL